MAGAMRKMGVYLGLVEDDDEYRGETGAADGYDYDTAEADRYAQAAAPSPGRREVAYSSARASSGPVAHQPSLVEPRSTYDYEDYSAHGDAQAAQSYRISSLCPSTYNEALLIGEHFRNGSPVIINLTEMDDAQAKRLIDFSAGLTFGLRGRLEKVTNKVFLLSPQNIDVTAEDRARIAEGTFFNQS